MKDLSAALFVASLAVVAMALTLTSCPGPYSGPVAVPTQLGAVETADCHAFTPQVWEGGRAPRHADKVTAQCADPSICTAYVENGEVVVWSNRPGTTKVIVTYVHPTTGEAGEAAVPLAFEAPTRGDWLHPRVSDPAFCKRDHKRPDPPVATP